MSPKAFRLMQYHQKLDSQLRRELKNPWPDTLRVKYLKRLKIFAKDRLREIALGQNPLPRKA